MIVIILLMHIILGINKYLNVHYGFSSQAKTYFVKYSSDGNIDVVSLPQELSTDVRTNNKV